MENKTFTTNDTILVFIIIVALIALSFGIGMISFSYSGEFWINKIHKEPILDIKTYYFYYQKATAYRMLFLIHIIFENTFKILGSTMTFITVYCAIDSNNYILLFSLISAMCQAIEMLIPTGKYAKIYVEASRVLEYELNKKYDDEETQKEKLREAYKKAEDIIQRDFV